MDKTNIDLLDSTLDMLYQGVNIWNKYVKSKKSKDIYWRANLINADLAGANLAGANLAGANLADADLADADLIDADLTCADLVGANLADADLIDANLAGADLAGADLAGADLAGADLADADLIDANLANANLIDANLRNAKYAITQIMLAKWGRLSDSLTRELQRMDAEAIPDGYRLMSEWAKGNGDCPFKKCQYRRVAQFQERRECWPPKRDPARSLWNIWKDLAKEKNVKISGVDD